MRKRRVGSRAGWAALLVAIALLVPPGAAGGAGTAASKETVRCGLAKADGFFLMPIFKIDGVSCRTAKRVARGALAKLGGDRELLCGRSTKRYRRWEINHVGPGPALHGRFEDGGRSFHLTSQGSC